MVERVPHPRPGAKPGAQTQQGSFPPPAGQEHTLLWPREMCSFCGGQWAQGATSRKLLTPVRPLGKCHVRSGRARSHPITPGLRHKSILGPCLMVRPPPTGLPPARTHCCHHPFHSGDVRATGTITPTLFLESRIWGRLAGPVS